MDKRICKICSKEFDSDASLHRHLKAHKITQTEYYQQFFPRYDRYTKKFILYKNKDFYFSADFNNRENFRHWLLSVDSNEAKKYVVEYMKSRMDKKKLHFSPTQVELKTLMLPGIKYINDNLGGFDVLCTNLGLDIRFTRKALSPDKFKDISRKVIFTDTREQNPLDFDATTRTKGMPFGDYRIAGSLIYVERKSLSDAWGTLTGGFDRFEREIIRAQEAGVYLVILIESPFTSLEEFPNQRQVRGKIKIPVEFVHHNIRELLQKYRHIQFLFVKDRDEASRIIPKLFSADEQVRDVDLQHLYDIKQL